MSIVGQFDMTELQRANCEAWLADLDSYIPRHLRRMGVAAQVVRGIVRVNEPEYDAAVEWAGGDPTAEDWAGAIRLYGPSGFQIQPTRPREQVLADWARRRDHDMVRSMLRAA